MSETPGAPRVCVVVPFYNVQRYLPRCLESIAAQDLPDFQAVLVDDGSSDGSYEIAAAFAAKDRRFSVIRQPNQGQGVARNTGLAACAAPYVCFLDSDDRVQPDYLSRMLTAMEREDADIVVCAYLVHMRCGLRYRSPLSLGLPRSMPREDALRHILRDARIKSFCWNKLFRRSLFESPPLSFESMYFEDVSAMPRLFWRARRVAVIQDKLYHYIKRPGSLMSTGHALRVRHAQDAMTTVRDFLLENQLYEAYRKDYRFCCLHFAIATSYVRLTTCLRSREAQPFRKTAETFRTIWRLGAPLTTSTPRTTEKP